MPSCCACTHSSHRSRRSHWLRWSAEERAGGAAVSLPDLTCFSCLSIDFLYPAFPARGVGSASKGHCPGSIYIPERFV